MTPGVLSIVRPVAPRTVPLASGTVRSTAYLLPLAGPGDKLREMIEKVKSYAKEAGRDPAAIGIEGRVNAAGGTPEKWRETVSQWKALGATHVSVNTMKAGLARVADHVNAIRRFREAVSGA